MYTDRGGGAQVWVGWEEERKMLIRGDEISQADRPDRDRPGIWLSGASR